MCSSRKYPGRSMGIPRGRGEGANQNNLLWGGGYGYFWNHTIHMWQQLINWKPCKIKIPWKSASYFAKPAKQANGVQCVTMTWKEIMNTRQLLTVNSTTEFWAKQVLFTYTKITRSGTSLRDGRLKNKVVFINKRHNSKNRNRSVFQTLAWKVRNLTCACPWLEKVTELVMSDYRKTTLIEKNAGIVKVISLLSTPKFKPKKYTGTKHFQWRKPIIIIWTFCVFTRWDYAFIRPPFQWRWGWLSFRLRLYVRESRNRKENRSTKYFSKSVPHLRVRRRVRVKRTSCSRKNHRTPS